MLQTSTQIDPVVEILRLAYQRGLALRRQQENIKNLNSRVDIALEQNSITAGDGANTPRVDLKEPLAQ